MLMKNIILFVFAALPLWGFSSDNGDPYPLSTCIVSGKKLGSVGDPVVYQHEGREIRFCSKNCIQDFEKDPAAYLKKIDEKIIQDQLSHYPLDTCVVSGEKLGGEMGEPVNQVYQNRLVRFCCKDCIKKFQKESAKYIAKLDEAVIAQQKQDYPLEKCLVSGETLGGEMGDAVDYVAGNRLFRFCCKDCIKDFRKNPAKYFEVLDQASMGKQGGAKEDHKGEEHKHEHDHEHDHGDGKKE